ncbi:MAG: fused MFS/spermidine synthase [Pseudomonadota bacterium]
MSIVAELQALQEKESLVLRRVETPRHTIQVREYRQYRWLQLGGAAIQSLIDTENPTRVVVPVNQAMLLSLAFLKAPQRALILGSGGGSFERFLRAYNPTIAIASVEKSQQVLELAHEYFCFPDDISVVNGRADHFLADSSHSHDVILCDIFEGEDHPACLATPLFHEQLASRLDKNGLLAVNLLTLDQQSLVEILKCARMHFNHTALYVVPNHNNAVLFAAKFQFLDAIVSGAVEKLCASLPDCDLNQWIQDIRALPQKVAQT